jgi:hypothetical protein
MRGRGGEGRKTFKLFICLVQKRGEEEGEGF